MVEVFKSCVIILIPVFSFGLIFDFRKALCERFVKLCAFAFSLIVACYGIIPLLIRLNPALLFIERDFISWLESSVNAIYLTYFVYFSLFALLSVHYLNRFLRWIFILFKDKVIVRLIKKHENMNTEEI